MPDCDVVCQTTAEPINYATDSWDNADKRDLQYVLFARARTHPMTSNYTSRKFTQMFTVLTTLGPKVTPAQNVKY